MWMFVFPGIKNVKFDLVRLPFAMGWNLLVAKQDFSVKFMVYHASLYNALKYGPN